MRVGYEFVRSVIRFTVPVLEHLLDFCFGILRVLRILFCLVRHSC